MLETSEQAGGGGWWCPNKIIHPVIQRSALLLLASLLCQSVNQPLALARRLLNNGAKTKTNKNRIRRERKGQGEVVCIVPGTVHIMADWLVGDWLIGYFFYNIEFFNGSMSGFFSVLLGSCLAR